MIAVLLDLHSYGGHFVLQPSLSDVGGTGISRQDVRLLARQEDLPGRQGSLPCTAREGPPGCPRHALHGGDGMVAGQPPQLSILG